MPIHTILVADDSHISRMLIGAIIRRTFPDAHIIEAEDGQDALDKIAGCKPTIATIDLNMPEIDGLELAQLLRARFPDLHMGLLTADAEDNVDTSTTTQLGLDFIAKPINETQILRFLHGFKASQAA